MRKAVLTVLLAGLAAFLFLNKRSPEVVPLQPHESILAFGDSITYGFGANRQESYPAVLQRLSGIRVINAGINGETSEEGKVRLPSLLRDDSIRLMLLCSGGNDILQQRPLARLEANVRAMITEAKKQNVDVILIGVPTFGAFGLSSLPLYERVAEEEGIAYMPSLLPDVLEERTLKNDYVHPNAAGYRVMAERVAERLRSLGYIE